MKFVAECLRHFVDPHQDDCDFLLPLAEFAYNSRVHSSIGMSPFMADLGYESRTVADCIIPTTRVSRAATFVRHQQAILAEAQDAMAAAQHRWLGPCDRNRPQIEFTVGDSVLLDTRNLDVRHIGTDGKRKLAARVIGPYKILQLACPDTYALDLPPGLRLHPDYHVSRLRPYYRDTDAHRQTRIQPVIVADGSEGHLVAGILGHQMRKGVRQFKLQWLDTSVKPSWEPISNLKQVISLLRQYVDTLLPTRATAVLKGEVSRA